MIRIFFVKVVDLVSWGSVINGATPSSFQWASIHKIQVACLNVPSFSLEDYLLRFAAMYCSTLGNKKINSLSDISWETLLIKNRLGLWMPKVGISLGFSELYPNLLPAGNYFVIVWNRMYYTFANIGSESATKARKIAHSSKQLESYESKLMKKKKTSYEQPDHCQKLNCRSPDFKKSNRSNKKIWIGTIIG